MKNLIEIFTKILGCLGGIVAFVFFILWFVAGCTKKPIAKVYSPKLIDSVSIFQKSTAQALKDIKFPLDIPVLIRTVDSIPQSEFGKYATKNMVNDAYWDQIKPFNSLRRYFRQQKPWDKGVYVLISRKPQLIQVRYGENIRLDAYSRGIASGPWYSKYQKYDSTGIDSHVKNLIDDLSLKLADINDQSGIIRMFKYLGSFLWAEVEDMIMISDNVFSNSLFKYYIKFMSWIGATNSIGFFLFISFVILTILYFINITFFKPLQKAVKSAGAKIGLIITAKGIEWLTIILSMAALLILTRGRVEDQLAMQYLGFTDIESFGIEQSFFTKRGGWLFAIPLAVIAFFKELIESNPPTRPNNVTIPFGFLGWGFLFFVLPKAIGIFLIFYLLVNFIKAIVEFVRADRY